MLWPMRRRRFFRLFALLAAPPWAAAQGEAPPAPQLARSYRDGLHLPELRDRKSVV